MAPEVQSVQVSSILRLVSVSGQGFSISSQLQIAQHHLCHLSKCNLYHHEHAQASLSILSLEHTAALHVSP